MAGIPAPVTVIYDLLQATCATLKLVTWTDNEGNAFSLTNVLPRRYVKIGGPYPQVLVFVSGDRLERPTQRQTLHNLTLTIQAWAGPVSGGMDGEMENRLNFLYMAIPAIFDQYPYLVSNFDYIYANGRAAIAESPSGTAGFTVDDGDNNITRFFGTQWLLNITLDIPRQRIN